MICSSSYRRRLWREMADLVSRPIRRCLVRVTRLGTAPVFFCRPLSRVPEGAVVFFPCMPATFSCGLAGMVVLKQDRPSESPIDTTGLSELIDRIDARRCQSCLAETASIDAAYLGGAATLADLDRAVGLMKTDASFLEILTREDLRKALAETSRRLTEMAAHEKDDALRQNGRFDPASFRIVLSRIEKFKDIGWRLSSEILQNVEKIRDLYASAGTAPSLRPLEIFRQVNAVLNSIERLEVRGRDSAGLSLLFVFDETPYQEFIADVDRKKLGNSLSQRISREVLVNGGISIGEPAGPGSEKTHSIALTYKIAAEVGSLGDNTRFIREQIRGDEILQLLVGFPRRNHTILSHTRWASVGAITEANCHPVDGATFGESPGAGGVIHVCLNGDIDNYLDLKRSAEERGKVIHEDISSDTKLIPLQIAHYLSDGSDLQEAFRRAVNDFEGSHAIAMHTDLAPGKLFLAQKGSGQAIFVGIAKDHYLPTSEVYGFVEQTSHYVKMDGESVVDGAGGKTQGQIFVLDQKTAGGPEGITAFYYDGTPIRLGPEDIRETEITSRDIDRQNFPHYFLKEISEAPESVEKTLLNRWKIVDNGDPHPVVFLDETVVPESIRSALAERRIRRIFFIGQGTAGVAAKACANILNTYLGDPEFNIRALKASELSGFVLYDHDRSDSMTDALVIAISQSGTTTDTNRTVDMVKERGAFTLAIVNRRDSDLTFKADGTLFTSGGRDIEMSVASTKAFYSQIVAGALLGLFIASLTGRRNAAFVAEEIRQLKKIPNQMRTVIGTRDRIAASAQRLAVMRTYWAAVGSGPNKAAADEIRIKLSELCYKTISSDFVEDKKHIDLSSEPLIIVCAAGSRGGVIGDIVKDTAIFRAHKALPIAIVDEGETRFDQYAETVFPVPPMTEHLAPILNTLVGHLWGYYAALTINEGSRFLYDFREDVRRTIEEGVARDLDIYEVVLEKSFREKIARFYTEFRRAKTENRLPGPMGLESASDLTLLLKYMAGRLPVSDFEIDFSVKGTALNMLNRLFECLGDAINRLARPVDAIKHQAKTVTVGTSRIQEKVDGILFDALESHNLNLSQLINRNILVLKNLQPIVSEIKGAILYRIDGLDLLGDPTDRTTIKVVQKEGVLKPIPSRVETDFRLKGTKRIIVGQGNVYIGKGRKDDRTIVVIPVISASPATPNIIEHLLLLNITFKPDVPLSVKVKALGGKYEHIKNIVQENSIVWADEFLDRVDMEELFGKSAEKIGEHIVSVVNGQAG